jgi:hypothetical protein
MPAPIFFQADFQLLIESVRRGGYDIAAQFPEPLPGFATFMGWSASTTVRMAKRYGHIGHNAQRLAVDVLCEPVSGADGAQSDGVQSIENVSEGARAS